MTAWKDIERTVAQLVGGTRTWWDPDKIDVIEQETGYAIECKNEKGLTIAACERYLKYNQAKADKRGLKNALVVKRRAGRGSRTPYLAIFILSEPVEDTDNG